MNLFSNVSGNILLKKQQLFIFCEEILFVEYDFKVFDGELTLFSLNDGIKSGSFTLFLFKLSLIPIKFNKNC